MRITIPSVTKVRNTFDTDTIEPIGIGGEGEVYKIPKECLINSQGEIPLVKIYCQNNVRMLMRQNKGLVLADKYLSFLSELESQTIYSAKQYAFPQNNALDASSREYVGFTMKDLGRYSTINCFQRKNGKITDVLTGYEMSDDEAKEFIYNLTYGVFLLHKHNIILGDLNEGNILYDTDRKLPLFLDIDSAQVDGYACDAYTDEVLDPLISRKRLDGSSDKMGAYEYTNESDIFALAVIAYRLIVGSYPAFYPVKGNLDAKVRRSKKKLFLMRVLKREELLKDNGLELINNTQLKNTISRLEEIRKNYPEIYQHFEDVFINDVRDYITVSLPISDQRHPDYYDSVTKPGLHIDTSLTETNYKIGGFNLEAWFKAAEGVRIRYSETMSDSDAFRTFVSNLGYNYEKLVAGVTV